MSGNERESRVGVGSKVKVITPRDIPIGLLDIDENFYQRERILS